jgi:hypothetical protein
MIETPRHRDYRVRLNTFDWERSGVQLWEQGWAVLNHVLSPEECGALTALYGEEAPFRGTVELASQRIGRGRYKSFSYPLPPMIETLREHAYQRLAPLAVRWATALLESSHYPAELGDMLALCRTNGQLYPTPLILRCNKGDYQCLHQELGGEIAFPFQMIFLLSHPGTDFTGGEFVVSEQLPRSQPSVEVIRAGRGDALIVPTRHHPVKSTRGFSRAVVRLGVSPVLSGQRFTLGIAFHDAR